MDTPQEIKCPCGKRCGTWYPEVPADRSSPCEPDYCEGPGEAFAYREKWYCSVECMKRAVEADFEKIRTTYVFPPIPTRNYDWAAVFDSFDADFDGERFIPLGPQGAGPTEADAIRNLVENAENWS